MIAGLIADLLVLIHLAFILFVLFGVIPVFRWRCLAFVHLPCVLWAGLIEFTGWLCPLTPLELYFRARAGEAGYAGGFVEHYLVPLIYPAGLTESLRIILGLVVLVLNLCLYGVVFFKLKFPAGKETGRAR
jgi:hypothetical protein